MKTYSETKKGKKKLQISNISNKKSDITTDIIDTKKIMMILWIPLCHILENLNEINKFIDTVNIGKCFSY